MLKSFAILDQTCGGTQATVFLPRRRLFELLTGESFDISEQGLDPLTPLIIKKDYVEFYVDVDTISQGRKMKDYPMIVRIGFDGKLIENISLDFINTDSIFKSFGLQATLFSCKTLR